MMTCNLAIGKTQHGTKPATMLPLFCGITCWLLHAVGTNTMTLGWSQRPKVRRRQGRVDCQRPDDCRAHGL